MNKYVKRSAVFRKKTTRRTGRLKKRWYFNAGATLPIIGKTNIAFGSGLQKRSLVNMVRARLEEPRHKLWAGNTTTGSTTLVQTEIQTLNLLGNIPQGDTDNSRTGDHIHLEALKFNMRIQNEGLTNDVPTMLRVMIVKHDNEYLSGSDAFGSGLGASDLFHGNTIPAKELIDSKKVTVLYDNVVKLQNTITGKPYCTYLNEIINLKTTFCYKSDSNYGKFANYYVVITGDQVGATTGVTQIVRVAFTGDLIFKDSR